MKLLSNQSECSFHCITVSKPVYTSNFKSLWSYIFPFPHHNILHFILSMKHSIFYLSLLLYFFFFLCLRIQTNNQIYTFRFSNSKFDRENHHGTRFKFDDRVILNFSKRAAFPREKNIFQNSEYTDYEPVSFRDYNR